MRLLKLLRISINLLIVKGTEAVLIDDTYINLYLKHIKFISSFIYGWLTNMHYIKFISVC